MKTNNKYLGLVTKKFNDFFLVDLKIQANYTLVIGSDLVKQICQWHHVDKLFSEVFILIILRSGYVIDKLDLQALVELGARYQIVDLNAPGVSSTTYRKYRDKNVLIKSVQDYIIREQLYV